MNMNPHASNYLNETICEHMHRIIPIALISFEYYHKPKITDLPFGNGITKKEVSSGISYEPISQANPPGRCSPRWSRLLMGVVPPLSASGARMFSNDVGVSPLLVAMKLILSFVLRMLFVSAVRPEIAHFDKRYFNHLSRLK